MQRSLLSAALVLTFVLAACGGGDAELGAVATTNGPTSVETTVAGEAPATTVAPVQAGGDATTTTADQPAKSSGVDGPAAPDFSLALSDGSTFVLSEAAKPVYMVFWAEW